MVVNSIPDRQWYGIPVLKMDLNRIAAFLGDEKINYFSMQRSAKAHLKTWDL